MKRKLNFILLLLLLVSMFLVACSGDSETPPAEQEPGESTTPDPDDAQEPLEVTSYQQSPFLDNKSELPPVEERLPVVPKIANELPEEIIQYEIGQYGGTLRTVRTDTATDTAIYVIQNEPLLNTPGMLGEEVTANIFEDFEVSDDLQEFTFYMREGLKWSDGHPVTVEDVQFAIEDVLFNEELTPGGVPPWLRSGATASGNPFEFEVLSDFSFKLSFDSPFGGFPIELAWQGWRGYTDLLKPKHYLEQYHTSYTSLEDLEEEIAQEGFEAGDWVNLFHLRDVISTEATFTEAIGFPVLSPYIVVKHGDIIEFERNPYYFKIDEEGNQLPYIDQLNSTLVQDTEMIIMKIIAGEVDHSYEYVSLPRIPLIKENEENGNYTLYINNMHRTANDIVLNLTYEDPVWREVVQDIRFRKALNLALDKNDIVDSIFYGFGAPSSIQESTYDLEEAKRLLDEMGMTVGADGYRVGPDGKRFSIPFEVSAAIEEWGKLAELVVEQWRLLDLDVSMKLIDGALFSTRNAANELMATVHWSPGPVQWARTDWNQVRWAPLWERWWVTGGQEGEEPPQEVKDLFEKIYSISTLSLEEAHVVREEIKAQFGEELWYFIHTEDIPAPVAVNKNIGNYNDQGWGIAHNFGAERWFYRE